MGAAVSFWTTHQHKIDVERFRAQEQYLGEQMIERFGPLVAHVRTLGNWLERLHEDGAFGCVTAQVDGVTVSRDLLDSIVEIDWLERCGVRPATVLDIGAGYGRLAHRMTTAWPRVVVTCTDEIEVSRFVCGRYLNARGVTRACVARPDQLTGNFDLAVNIHSWPECARDEIHWWLKKLIELQVPRLFVIPHLDGQMLCLEDGRSFLPDILARGYEIEHHWRGPECWARDFYLFRRP